MLRVASVDDFPPVPEPDSAAEANSDLVDVLPPEAQADGERRMIRLTGANFSGILDEMEEVLNPYVYTQGTHLARTSEAHNDGAIQRSTDALMLISASQEWARKRFGQLCDFKKYVATRDQWESVAPPAEHVSAMLGLGSWSTLRPLDAIARAPFLREDGSICDVAGYDTLSRTLYVPSIEFPPIPENPTREDALAALASPA